MERVTIAAPAAARGVVKALSAVVPNITEGQLWTVALADLTKKIQSLSWLSKAEQNLIQERLDLLVQDPEFKPLTLEQEVSGEEGEPAELYLRFWTSLVQDLEKKLPDVFPTGKTIPSRNWLTTSLSPQIDLNFSYGRGKIFRVELFLSGPLAKERYEMLRLQRDTLEASLGPISWEPLPDKQSCRVASVRQNSFIKDPDDWDACRKWAIEHYAKARAAYLPLVGALKSVRLRGMLIEP